MKHSTRTLPLLLAATLTAGLAQADWDAAAEARRQAAREAATREQAAKQREHDRLKADAEAKGQQAARASMRKSLGQAAEGKSDAEMARMVQERSRATQVQATAKQREIAQGLSTGHGAAAVRGVTGHSTQELMNMSDAQLDALSREMERKHAR